MDDKIFSNFNSYHDFVAYQKNAFNTKNKGDAFEALVYHYLTLHPSYITKLKNVWHWKNVAPSVLVSLGVPSQDLGIDILAETFEGSYWAIQCKYISDEEHSVGHGYISTFTSLAFGICKNIEFALLCTTADRFSSKLAMYEGKLGILAGDIWRGLDEEFFAQIKNNIEHKAINLQPKLPRPHQTRAIIKAVEYFLDIENTKGKLIMPCGTGKSLTGFWIAEALSANSILVALPSLSLIRQTLEVWTREAVANAKNIEWLVVCSDDSVSDIDNDDIAILTQDLGIAVDTDIDKITRWLNDRHQRRVVLFSTYQSGKITAEAARKSNFAFELGIFDEAHKTVGKDGGLFSHLIYDKNIKINRKIFMTATERHYKGNSEKIASMDNPLIYGDDFEVLSFKEALQANPPILCDYKIITMLINSSEIASLIEQNIAVSDNDGRVVESEMLAAMIALNKAMDKYPIKHAVSFHSSIKKAKTFKELIGKFNSGTEVFHVSGKTPTASRSKMINNFAASQKAVITNARCLTEGVDVPGIDTVLFANPRKSAVDIVQAVGRALRIYDGKQYGYVIVPVVIDSDNLEESEAGAYDAVITVLKALAANDERLVDYFGEISNGKQSASSSPLIIESALSDAISLDVGEFAKAVELKIWSSTKKLAWRPFEKAREFVRDLGLDGVKEWQDYCKSSDKPHDIPSSPSGVYARTGWLGMADWLGNEWLKFEEAREFARGLGLNGIDDWKNFCKSDDKPSNIPLNPNVRYAYSGWAGWRDWLGNEWLKLEEAREFVRSLGLKDTKAWQEYCKNENKPLDIPTSPQNIYANQGWISMPDWLGSKGNKGKYLPFEEARAYIHSVGLTSAGEWKKWTKGELPEKGTRPSFIPSMPDVKYRDQGWESWSDWIGNNKWQWLSFEEAREYVRALKLSGSKEWNEYCKSGQKPNDIPANPNISYKDNGWLSMADWLGNEWLSFEEAREFVRSLGLKGQAEWKKYNKGEMPHLPPKPSNIPVGADRVYAEQWQGFGDWIGTGRIRSFGDKNQWRPFEDAREFVRNLGLKDSDEWQAYLRGEFMDKELLPSAIPNSPQFVYKNDGWVNMADWIGNGQAKTRGKPADYETARNFVRTLGIKNSSEWAKYAKGEMLNLPERPDFVPAQPSTTYKNKGWISWSDWLGSETINSRGWMDFEEAKNFVHALKLQTSTEWRAYREGKLSHLPPKPNSIPVHPDRVYGQYWQGWNDWLGIVEII